MIEHALGLFLRTRESADGDDNDLGGDGHLGLEENLDGLGGLVKADATLRLDGEHDDVAVLFLIMGDIDLVLAGYAVYRAEDLLDLTGEHIDAVHLEHIVRSALGP